MKARFEWHGDTLEVDFSKGQSLAIDFVPGGPHPTFFTDSEVKTRPLSVGEFVGDMKQGGSCNAEVFEFSPHSHGTHTECLGHIETDHQSVTETIDQRPTLMRIMTIGPEMLEDGSQIPASVFSGIEQFDGKALAIRTLPNEDSKKHRNYNHEPRFPVLSPEAMNLLSRTEILHLLVDTPSVDRSDNTKLENHSAWWGLETELNAGVPDASQRSITEMIYIPNKIHDGDYWLDLQLPPLISDAVPSRPMIYPVTRTKGSL